MQIKIEDFNKIVEYTKQVILRHVQLVNTIEIVRAVESKPVPINAVSEHTILALSDIVTLEKFLEVAGEKKERVKTQESETLDSFGELWALYPATGSFKYKGMEFKSSRILRSNRSVCHSLYIKSLMSNKVKPEVILNALKRQLHLVKEESYESGTNKLQFLPALEVWLRQEVWQALTSESDEDISSDTQDIGNNNSSNYA